MGCLGRCRTGVPDRLRSGVRRRSSTSCRLLCSTGTARATALQQQRLSGWPAAASKSLKVYRQWGLGTHSQPTAPDSARGRNTGRTRVLCGSAVQQPLTTYSRAGPPHGP